MTERGVDAPSEYREFASARAAQLFRIAFLMCGDWHEAEDLVQTTLAKVFVAWDRVRQRDSVETYARKVMLNAFLSQRRLRRSGEMPTADFGDVRAPEVDADLRVILLAALRQLPPRSRAVVVMRYVEDYSIECVAQLMGATPSAVKSLNTRGFAQLRELLGADQDLLRQ